MATHDPGDNRQLSAIPSPLARGLAFVAVLLGGVAGGLIGYSMVSLQCNGSCGAWLGLGTLVGAITCAAGMSVVAVLVMRAQGEWREVQDREQAGHPPI